MIFINLKIKNPKMRYKKSVKRYKIGLNFNSPIIKDIMVIKNQKNINLFSLVLSKLKEKVDNGILTFLRIYRIVKKITIILR
jgi:hypothetical protein